MNHLFDVFRLHRLRRKGQKLLNRGRSQEALTCFEKAVLLQSDPENRFNLALALTGLNRYEEALSHLEKIQVELPDEEDNEILILMLADCYLQLRRWDEATAAFARLVEIRPSSERYQDYLALVRDPVGRDKHVVARELFGEAQTLMDEKKPREALDKMRESFEMNPHNAMVANNVGSLMLLLKQPPDEALIYFEKAVMLEPDNQRYKENLSWVKRKARL